MWLLHRVRSFCSSTVTDKYGSTAESSKTVTVDVAGNVAANADQYAKNVTTQGKKLLNDAKKSKNFKKALSVMSTGVVALGTAITSASTTTGVKDEVRSFVAESVTLLKDIVEAPGGTQTPADAVCFACVNVWSDFRWSSLMYMLACVSFCRLPLPKRSLRFFLLIRMSQRYAVVPLFLFHV